MSLHCVVCLLWAWLSSLFSWVAAHTVQFPKREVWESPLVSWGGCWLWGPRVSVYPWGPERQERLVV